MAFDLEAARKEGYSDQEILSHLAETRAFDLAGARKAGYSDAEILGHLSGQAGSETAFVGDPAPEHKGFGGKGASGGWDAPPSGIGHEANVAARGVYKGLSSMVGAPVDVINWGMGKVTGVKAEKPVGGSDWLMENVFDPFQPGVIGRPQNSGEQILQAAGEGVGAAAIPAALWLRAAKLVTGGAQVTARTKTLVDQMARLAVDDPAKFAALEASSAATGGAGAESARMVAESAGGGPVAQTLAATAGGLVGGMAPLGAGTLAKKTYGIRPTEANAAAKGKALAGDVLFQGTTENPLATQTAQDAFAREAKMNTALIGAGSPENVQLTTPEVTRNPKMQALYQSRRTSPDSSDLGSKSFLEEASARQAGNERALSNFAPSSTGDIRDAMQNVKAQRDALQSLATKSQEQLVRTVEGLVPGLSTEDVGRLIRAALQGQDEALGRIYKPLFAAVESGGVPPAEGMPLLQSLREWSATEKPGLLKTLPTENAAYKKQYEARLKAEQEKRAGKTDEINVPWAKPEPEVPDTAPKLPLRFDELDDLEKALGTIAARYRRNDPGNRTAIEAIDAQQRSVRQIMDGYGEGAGAEARQALEDAKAAFREYAAPAEVKGGKYGMRSEEVLDTLATSREGMATPEAGVPKLFWKPGAESGQGAQRLIDALGAGKAQSLLEPEAMRSMLAVAWDAEKQSINPTALARWKRHYDPALSRFPAIKAKFDNVAALQKEAATRAGNLKDLEQRGGAAFKALTGETPEAVGPRVMGGDDPVGNMKNAIALVKDSPNALEGLKAGVIDTLKGNVESAKVPAPGDAPRLLVSNLKRALDPSKKTRSALVELFGQDGIERWDDTLNMAGILARSSEHPNVGSPTATLANFQTAASRKMHGLTLLMTRIGGKGAGVATQVIEHTAGPWTGAGMGSLIGASAAGIPGAIAGGVTGGLAGSYMKLARMTTEQALKALDAALLNPQKYAALWDDHLARTNAVAQKNLARLILDVTGEQAVSKPEDRKPSAPKPSSQATTRQIYYNADGTPRTGYLNLIGR